MGRSRTPRGFGGCVDRVDVRSLGRRMGVRPGDVLLAVNGHPLHDVIDFRYYSAEPEVEMDLRRGGGLLTLTAAREINEPLGIEFAHPTFDVDIRRCRNHCEFCFVAQSPRGMRRALYVKDDDYRYSFLFGQFVTLTNLTGRDWQRIEEQHLSPLYVSVHATEPELRRRLLGSHDAPDVMSQLRWLADRNIQVHAQIVLIPGQNDGSHLERSLQDLVGMYPAVQSISLVPVGLTRQHASGLRPYRHEEADDVLEQVKPWRERCRSELGVMLVYPSDEWYLLAGQAPPDAADYDGFGQLENGVGVVRRFLDDWEDVKARIGNRWPVSASLSQQTSTASLTASMLTDPSRSACRATAVCGELAAPVLKAVFAEMSSLLGVLVDVRPVVNHWYGGAVSVSGLLTGHDVTDQLLGGPPLGDLVLLPRVMFNCDGQNTLDDMTVDEIQRLLGVAVAAVQEPAQVETVLTTCRSGAAESATWLRQP